MTDVLKPVDMNIEQGKDGSPKKKKKRLSVERIYQKKSQLEHILLRPDAYIGSVEPEHQTIWVLEEEEERKHIIQKQITVVPGFYKIFDEILVNAADNKQRDKEMNTIKIVIDQEKNFISIWNNGRGIPIELHKEQDMFVPTLIFGHLLTSSNYDDTQKKVTGGRNGFGAKLCNIFSTKFTVETACSEYGKKFKQVWSKNMTKAGEPEITEFKGKDYTKVSYSPDLAKFHMESLDDDIVALLRRRAYDIAGTSKGVAVHLNGEKLNVKSFRDYVEMYMKGASKMAADDDDEDGIRPKIVHEVFHPRWEVCVTVSKSGFQQASFVNSIATTKGGTHVNYIVDQIVEKMITAVQRKTSKEMKVKPFQIKNHLWVFVNCLIENPTFDSQTKENMTLRQKAFGSTCEVNEKFIKMVQGCGVMDSIMNWVKFKSQEKMNKQCSHNKKSKVKIPKLDDANDAGGKNSAECTLILTEGDSAKTLAISGLSVVGRDRYGVFPLKGKLLNVRDAPSKQIAENVEITSLLQILGLNFKKKYSTAEERKTLRYGKVMIMADQDQDGSHIKGLVINFIHANWPQLLREHFLEEFITPIVKVTKGKEKISFFSLPEFEQWRSSTPNHHTWKVKYYKGLGTSTSDEAKEYFKAMERHRIQFSHDGAACDQAIEMAFSKKHVQSRKDWLTRGMEERRRRRELGMPELYLYQKDTKAVTFTEFVNKELILFSNADNERSIPSVVDGLKPGQRKVLFTCFKRNDKKEVKVAQLAGSVAELSAYHHGENSLLGTIINLAQNFVGSNNVNLLQPIGAFGSRIHGGKDAASPRYIFTMLSPLTRLIFPPKDDVLLRYLSEDNQRIEPDWYCPIIPMVLVNGTDGIGTGYRSLIPNHCPRQLANNIKRMLAGEEPESMIPFFKKFKGTIEQVEAQKFNIYGNYRVLDEKSFEITELPARTWTSPYKEGVLDLLENGSQKVKAIVAGIRDHSTDKSVHFTVTMLSEEEMTRAEEEGITKKFKLETSISTSSMVLHDRYGCLKKYESQEEILKEFFEVRLEKYKERKAYYEGFLEAEAEKLKSQARFILEKIDGLIVLEKRSKRDVVISLVERGYPSDPVKSWKSENHSSATAEEDSSETASTTTSSSSSGPDFTYLLNMALLSLTQEKIDELMAQRDAKIEELNQLRMKTAEELWEEDLDVFLAELDCLEEEERQRDAEGESLYMAGGGKGRKGKAGIKAKPVKNAVEKSSKGLGPTKKEASGVAAKNKVKEIDEKKTTEASEPLSLAERLAKKAAATKGKSGKKPTNKSKWDFDSSEDDIDAFSHDLNAQDCKRSTRKVVKNYALSDSNSSDNSNDSDSLFSNAENEALSEDVDEFDAARAVGASKKPVKGISESKDNAIPKGGSDAVIELLSDSENSEIEATKALIMKLSPAKPKGDTQKKERKAMSHAKKGTRDLLDMASPVCGAMEVNHLTGEVKGKIVKAGPKQTSIFAAATKICKKDVTEKDASVQHRTGEESLSGEASTKTKKGETKATGKSKKKPPPARQRKRDLSTSDQEGPIPTKKLAKKKAPPKSRGKTRRKDVFSSSEDENDASFDVSDDGGSPVRPSVPRERRAVRAKTKVCYQISSDEQSDDDDFEP